MSILFYRRPDFVAKLPSPLTLAECQAYIDKTQKHRKAIPAELSFEKVVHNKALPPCSLEDFMQYMVYVSHDAENLQFWLWLQDYVKRFFALPRAEQALSPPYDIEAAQASASNTERLPKPKSTTDKNVAELMLKLENIGSMRAPAVPGSFDGHSFVSGGTYSTRTVAESVEEANAQAGLKWQPFTIQPFRAEINRIISQYLAPNAPRELNLSQRDRCAVLHALQHTTHPSAFLGVSDVVEAGLRTQSHPNFIRWSICNGNKPRVLFVLHSGIFHVVAGLILAAFLVLSGLSRWWRLFALPLFLVGFSIGVAAHRGLCVIIHSSRSRAVRPWEQVGELASSPSIAGTFDEEGAISMDDRSTVAHRSTKSTLLDPFGPPSSRGHELWMARYKATPLMRKIFAPQIWIKSDTIRMLQDRIVLQSHLWSVLISVPLTAALIALPEFGVM